MTSPVSYPERRTTSASNPKKIILRVVVALIIFACVIALVVGTAVSNIKRAAQRTGADFVTNTFVVREIWIETEKQNGRIISERHLIKPQDEEFRFSLPFSALQISTTIDHLKNGDTIRVKTLRTELESARQGGFIYWLKHGERRVSAYEIALNGKIILPSEDITRVNEFESQVLANVPRQIVVIVIPVAVIALGISFVVRKKRQKQVDSFTR